MTLSQSVANTIEMQAYEYVARALIIREFWRHCSGTHIFEFSYNTKDKWDVLLGYMKPAFFSLVDEHTIIQWAPQDDFHYELWILQAFEYKDDYYGESTDISKIGHIYDAFLKVQWTLQYSIERQDEILKNILSEAFRKFGRHMQKFNLYSFLSDEERAEYFQYINLFLGLLRLEKEKYISIEWLWSFCFVSDTNEYFAECSILILDEPFFSVSVSLPTQHSEKAVNSLNVINISIEDDYSLLVDNIIIETTPIQKVYLKHLKLDELLDGLSIDELARRYEWAKFDDDRWENAKKRVKNTFTTLNSKIYTSSIHKKDIFVISQATGISLNWLYDFQISWT